MKNNDPVFLILQTMLANSPERSYARLNPSLRSTLADCISADLPFQRDTFARIYKELRGAYWFGDGAGSHVGEHYYTQAVACNHASAIQSFENFAGRPGVLWDEEVATPVRLTVGSQFTWKQHYVTVTSLRPDSLVACTYQGSRDRVEGLKVGTTFGYQPKQLITRTQKKGKTTILHVVKAPENHGESVVKKRFTITYAELNEVRRKHKAKAKAICDLIAKCDPANQEDVAKLTKQINAGNFRHWELEQFKATYAKRKEALEKIAAQAAAEKRREAEKQQWEELRRTEPLRIAAWLEGKGDTFLVTDQTLLRIKDERVECSNGNSVSLAAAKAVLPIIIAHRAETFTADLPVDSFRVKRVSKAGVQVGCTLVGWEQIDRILPALQS